MLNRNGINDPQLKWYTLNHKEHLADSQRTAQGHEPSFCRGIPHLSRLKHWSSEYSDQMQTHSAHAQWRSRPPLNSLTFTCEGPWICSCECIPYSDGEWEACALTTWTWTRHKCQDEHFITPFSVVTQVNVRTAENKRVMEHCGPWQDITVWVSDNECAIPSCVGYII